ncbi:MAG: antitoxin VbhA family protein [Ruminobacter sp.]|jgi:hypothetical protein|uniref:Antitoxin VbhA domain-containing protein n=1 Tax=Ruminobacter amylophilus TaxID=867 RepID=A0A662ZKY1_9GAMM|nr:MULTISPECIES: antitoxin VbhA family protein [Ruminobacter]MBQ3776377.1 antitoxin VbhA family protein [Ruminobacter sp.]SFP66396.1 hypothetical protein SAMN02910344_02002 [Ruminobacter amylophilus]
MIKYIYIFRENYIVNKYKKIMKNNITTPIEIYQSEASVKEVQATMHMEGFNLTDDELTMLNDCISGRKSSEEIRKELIAKIIFKKNNA